MAKIDHAAIRTASYENAQKFFEDVFEMHMWREIGEKPGRKCWYEEGIQLCEMEEINTEGENRIWKLEVSDTRGCKTRFRNKRRGNRVSGIRKKIEYVYEKKDSSRWTLSF